MPHSPQLGHKDLLWQSDIISTAIDGTHGSRTDAEREMQGIYFILCWAHQINQIQSCCW
jgi:hypothetical protein